MLHVCIYEAERVPQPEDISVLCLPVRGASGLGGKSLSYKSKMDSARKRMTCTWIFHNPSLKILLRDEIFNVTFYCTVSTIQ